MTTMRDALIAVGGGGLSAAAWLAAPNGPLFVLLLIVAPLPLLLVGLGLGVGAGALAALTGATVIAVLAESGVVAAALFGGVQALPSWLVVRQALSGRASPASGSVTWTPIGSVLGGLTAFAVLAAVAGLVAGAGTGDEFKLAIREQFSEAFAVMAPNVAPADRISVIESVVPLLPGIGAATFALMIAFNAVVAQTLVAQGGRALRPRPDWSSLSLPGWMSWLLVIAIVTARLDNGDAGTVAVNALIVLTVPFFLLGLATAHAMAARTPAPGLVLMIFYLCFLLTPLGGMLVAALGVAEDWAGVRRRFAPPRTGQGA